MQTDLFENAFKFASIGMALVSPDGRWLKVNDAVLQLYGYSEEELLSSDFLEMTHPEDLKTDLDLVNELLAGKRETYQMEKRYFHKLGHIIYAVLSVSLIRNADGSPRFFISQIQDVSELKKIQINMQNSSKMVALGEMAAGIAHEINNPVTIINLHTEALNQLLNEPELNIEMMKVFTQKISGTINRIGNIISSLKNFSNDNKKFEKFVSHKLSSIVNDTLGLCLEKFNQHGVKLTQDVPRDLVFDCNPVDISQVLLNLINNAFYAIKNHTQKEISLKVVVSKESFDIVVSDSGPGIPDDVKPKLLTPFFTTKPIGEGTGLGLSISKSIITVHKGELFLDELAPRTTFVIRLPLKLLT
jgi:two-component system cell cycle sensor histidine kinase/response regulator CckA